MDAYQQEAVDNIRRNVKKMFVLLEIGNDRDSQLVDLLLHIETLLQQLPE